MNIINYTKQYLDKEDKKIILEVLNSSNLTQGKYVNKFENNPKKIFQF